MSQYSFDENQLNTITELARVFFTEEEVSQFMGIAYEDFKMMVKNIKDPVHRSYYSGWRQSEFELRKLILNSAIAGSTPAQNLILDIRKKAYSNRLK